MNKMNFIKRKDLPNPSTKLTILMPDNKYYYGFLSITEEYYVVQLTNDFNNIPIEGVVSWEYGILDRQRKVI